MPREIADISDIGTGDKIIKGMQTFEVVDVQPEPEGFGPPFKATVEAQKDLDDFGTAGERSEMGKGEILGGFEFVALTEPSTLYCCLTLERLKG